MSQNIIEKFVLYCAFTNKQSNRERCDRIGLCLGASSISVRKQQGYIGCPKCGVNSNTTIWRCLPCYQLFQNSISKKCIILSDIVKLFFDLDFISLNNEKIIQYCNQCCNCLSYIICPWNKDELSLLWTNGCPSCYMYTIPTETCIPIQVVEQQTLYSTSQFESLYIHEINNYPFVCGNGTLTATITIKVGFVIVKPIMNEELEMEYKHRYASCAKQNYTNVDFVHLIILVMIIIT